VVAAIWLCGCSPDHYARQADLDVQSLVRDREKQTLDYTPQVDAPLPELKPIAKKAYDRIPTSPIPPKGPPALEIEKVLLPHEPLGPDISIFEGPAVGADWGAELAARYKPHEALGPPLPQDLTRRFDLFASLAYAVQHSRNYQDQMDDLYTTALAVTLERHLFTPRPFANTSVLYTGGQKTSDYKSALTVSNRAGVRQQLPYGGEVVASGLVQFVNAINGNVDDGESASVALSGSMPLLRGFGMVNLEPLIASERTLVYAVRDFEEFRRSFAVQIARTYFNLLAGQQGIRNRRINLALSIDLRERSQALYDANRLSGLEVQRARQQELTAQSQLINAEENYQSQLDAFKLLLGMPVEEALDVASEEMTVPVLKLTPDQAVELAHRYRLTLSTAADRVNDAMRVVKNSQNNLLPDLTLTASGTAGNETNTPAVELQGRTSSYSAGVTLDLPIDRLRERNQYRVALINLQKAQRDYTGAQDSVTAEVREALRSLRAAEISLEIQRVSIELAQRRVEFANIRLTQGVAGASNRDVVEAQQDLLSAQDSYEQARSQVQISVLNYLRVTGTLRVDPDSGTLGRVMDRAGLQANNSFRAR
jgi:outer membrane protein TolC